MNSGNIHPKSPLNGHKFANAFPMMDQTQMAQQIESVRTHGQTTKIVLLNGDVLDGRNTLFAVLECNQVPEFREFGSDPKDGDSPAAYVITHNLHRRHLSPGQRATSAVEFVPFFEEEAAARMKAGQFKKAAEPAPEIIATPTPSIEGITGGEQESNVIAGEFKTQAASPVVATSAAPATKKPSKKGTAVQQAAEMFSVSPTLVKLGRRLKKDHPALYEKVLNKEMTVHAADTEAKRLDEEKKNTVSTQTQRTERLNAIRTLEERHGEKSAFLDAVKNKKVLKGHGDLLEFADMPRKKAFTILPLVKLGWKPKKAAAYIDARATSDTTVAELIAMATLSAGDIDAGAEIVKAFVVEGFTVTLHREAKTEAEQPPESSPADVEQEPGAMEPGSEEAPAAE